MSDDPERIMRFWQAVEVFSPQSLPKRDRAKNTWDIRPGESMPWEPGFRLDKPRPGNVWRHDVYGGVYELRGVRDALVAAYGQDRPEDAPARGESALFACTVGSDGRLLEGSTIVSACAWAVGRIGRGESPIAGFGEETRQHADDIATAAEVRAGVRVLATAVRDAMPEGVADDAPAGENAGEGAPPAGDQPSAPTLSRAAALTEADLRTFVTGLAGKLGVTDSLRPSGLRVRSYQVKDADPDDEDQDEQEEVTQPFLNSLLADDLAAARGALNSGDIGTALASYLTSSDQIDVQRTDVRQNPARVLDGCRPDLMPAGRWVSDTARPLSFSQQFAVNQVMRAMGDGQPGLFAVNGPPGTGKTTMLRDLVAAIVVRRATALASLERPGDAFGGGVMEWATETFTHFITPLIPALTGYEIVVASSNNAAVENVTAEIPGAGAVAGQWKQDAADLDYFRLTAGQVTGDGAWALVAAVLGNSENRSAFVQKFWWGGQTRKPRPGTPGPGADRRRPETPTGMRDLLKPAGGRDWYAARDKFRQSLAKVQSLSSERMTVARHVARLPQAVADRDRKGAELLAATTEREKLESRRASLKAELEEAEERWQAASSAVATHVLGRPGPMSLLTGAGRRARKTWEDAHAALQDRFVRADSERASARDDLAGIEARIARKKSAEAPIRSEYQALEARARDCEDAIADARRRWGDHVPDGAEYGEAERRDLVEKRELSAPWADEEFGRARTELFLAALALHKAFVGAEARRIYKNLNALMDVLNRKGRPEPEALLAAWQTLFLVVPVVSSTFASFGRLFAGLGRESLGWLLVDEAGQAAPQNAVGALWRCRRAVIVGDPLQLEPVVTLPWGGQQALLREFGVSLEWAPSRTSVQQVADRLAAAGAWLPGPAGDPVWVGTPLRVHRRCDRPMFEVSNRIAYDGLMVFGTPGRDRFHGADAWYDVRSAVSVGHWLPDEGNALRDVLSHLRDAGVPAAGIRVLSPFRDVVSEAAKIHAQTFPDVAPADRDGWVGTVHRMQGREADAVILILGGDPGKPGARRFAVQAPNLLNVAVTRARRRLYVIGNRDTWGAEPFFTELTDEALLRHYRP